MNPAPHWPVRLGVSPLSWMNDDLPVLGAGISLDLALAQGREIGFEGFELGGRFPDDGAQIKARLDGYGLACVASWYGGTLAEASLDAELARCGPPLRRLRDAGGTVVVYGETAGAIHGRIDQPLARRPRLHGPGAWRDYAARLDAFGRHLLDDWGLRLAFHPHAGTCVESPDDIDRLMDLTDPVAVGLTFDTGHAALGGADDVGALLRRHLPRIAHVHCKDVRPALMARARNEGWSFLRGVLAGVFTVPGDGALDFSALLQPLRDAGWRGWLVVEAEQDPTVAPPLNYARIGHATLRRIIDAPAPSQPQS